MNPNLLTSGIGACPDARMGIPKGRSPFGSFFFDST